MLATCRLLDHNCQLQLNLIATLCAVLLHMHIVLPSRIVMPSYNVCYMECCRFAYLCMSTFDADAGVAAADEIEPLNCRLHCSVIEHLQSTGSCPTRRRAAYGCAISLSWWPLSVLHAHAPIAQPHCRHM
jgi:hypothetical protein